MASDTISGAIVAQYQATPALTAACPNLFLDEIPETDGSGNAIQLPFAQLTVNEETPEWNFESAYHDVDQVTITVYATSAAGRDAILALFETAFDWSPSLPTVTQKAVQLLRLRTRKGTELIIDPNGERVFHAAMDYQVMITRQAGAAE